MRTHMLLCLRILAVSLALGFVTGPAVEASWPAKGAAITGQAAPRRETLWGLPRDHPAIAIGAVIGAAALIVLFAYIAARVGDKY